MAKKKKNKGSKKGKAAPLVLKEGVVTRSTGSWYNVKLEDGSVLECKLRGRFRNEVFKSTNPVAVGDRVRISVEEEVGLIREMLPRRNYVLRKAVNLSRRVHILCSNIDQALILFTLTQPVTTLGYIDRLLVICEAYGVPTVLLFNKVDLVKEDGLEAKLEEFKAVYEAAGYPCIALDATDPDYREKLQDLLRDKTSFVVGRSGAGKSTVINLADPSLDLKTGNISDWSSRGKHTTVYAEMFDLAFGGAIIDSPGFKEMEIVTIEKGELTHYFPDLKEFSNDCKFYNCIHRTEPHCAVKEAVKAGKLAESRYHTYLSMLAEIEANEDKYGARQM